MKTKHTQSDWKTHGFSIVIENPIEGTKGVQLLPIAHAVQNDKVNSEEMNANLKLMAASPKILEQLNKIVTAIEDGSINRDHIEVAREIIRGAGLE